MILLLACLPRTSSECTRAAGCADEADSTTDSRLDPQADSSPDSPADSPTDSPVDHVAELVDKGRTYATIQEAIVDASDGDVVLVQPGTHHERIDFHGKDIVVRSALGAESTVLDGDLGGTVVSARAMEPATAMLQGFTITNGIGVDPDGRDPGVPHGGGIFVENADLVIRHNIIEGNTAFIGGGIYLRHGEAVVENNLIIGNHADEGGGGVTCTNCKGVVRYNTFIDNTSRNGPMGEWFFEVQGDIIANVVVLGEDDPFAIRFMQPLGYTFAVENNLLSPAEVPWIDPDAPEAGEWPEDLDTVRDDPVFDDGYHLAEGSPGVDQGPEDELDPDGTRADIGMYGGPHGAWE